MADIRKITLLAGEKDSLYEIGDKLTRGGKVFTVEALYMESIGVGDALELPVVRIYVEEIGSPFVDIPYHAISRIFYS